MAEKKKTTRKRKTTDFTIVEKGQMKQSTALRDKVEGVPDREIEGMTLNLDQIKPFERNPRNKRNPQYESIKESIRAVGLKNRLNVTKRPSDDQFVLSYGGKTRYTILRELYEETGDKKFYNLKVDYSPYTNEMDLLAWHMTENDTQGEMTFFDKARAVISIRDEWISENPNEKLTVRKLSKICIELGWSNANYSVCSAYIFAVDSLSPFLTNCLNDGIGKRKVMEVRKYASSASNYAEFMSDSGLDKETAIDLWNEVLKDNDDPDLFNIDQCWSRYAVRLSELLELPLSEVETQLLHIHEHGKPYDGQIKYVEFPAAKESSPIDEAVNSSSQKNTPSRSDIPQKPSISESPSQGLIVPEPNTSEPETELKTPSGPRDQMRFEGHAGILMLLHPIINDNKNLGWLIRGEVNTPPYFNFREDLFIGNYQNTMQTIQRDFSEIEQYTVWRLAIFQMTYRFFIAKEEESQLDINLDETIRTFSNYQAFHCLVGASPHWTEQRNINKDLVERFHQLHTLEANFDSLARSVRS